MTREEIHSRIVTLAAGLAEAHMHISEGHPADDEGFVQPADPDLAEALKIISHAETVLTRLAFRMAQDEL